MNIFLERKFGTHFKRNMKNASDEIEGSREGQIYMLKTDHTFFSFFESIDDWPVSDFKRICHPN
jgi:hypothetical protein